MVTLRGQSNSATHGPSIKRPQRQAGGGFVVQMVVQRLFMHKEIHGLGADKRDKQAMVSKDVFKAG